MRIHLVTSEYTGVTSYTGGIGSQYAAIGPALAAQGVELHVVTLGDGAAGTAEHDGVSFSLVRVPRLAPVAPAAWPAAAARALRRLPQPDAVVAAEYSAGAAVYAAGRRRAPLLTHLHSSLAQIVRSSQWSWRRRLLPQTVTQLGLERFQAKRSDGLISVSAQLLDWARELWPIERLPAEIVPNAIDVRRVRELAAGEPPSELAGEGPLVLFAGRLEQRKGVHVLAEAMREVWAAIPSARLALAGGHDGEWQGRPMSERLRELAGERADRLVLLGHLPPERLFPCLARADVVALPSLWEPFSIAALEAMAAGKALVATSGVFPGFVDDGRNALLAPPGEAKPLGAALVRVLEDPALAERLGAEGGRTAELHDVEPSARRFTAAVEALL